MLSVGKHLVGRLWLVMTHCKEISRSCLTLYTIATHFSHPGCVGAWQACCGRDCRERPCCCSKRPRPDPERQHPPRQRQRQYMSASVNGGRSGNGVPSLRGQQRNGVHMVLHVSLRVQSPQSAATVFGLKAHGGTGVEEASTNCSQVMEGQTARPGDFIRQCQSTRA